MVSIYTSAHHHSILFTIDVDKLNIENFQHHAHIYGNDYEVLQKSLVSS